MFKKIVIDDTLQIVPNQNIKHSNYLEYLACCWNTHYGAVVTPDILWHMVLCELAIEIRKKPDDYSDLFTNNSKEKTMIILPTTDPRILPLDDLMERLTALVPSNVEAFLPDFTTTTNKSKFARYAAFADLVSPYYSYSTMMCGLRSVTILGDRSDWEKFQMRLVDLRDIFEKFPRIQNYFKNVFGVINRILNSNDPKEFKEMFYLERCGSGSEYEVCGWILKMYMEYPSLRKIQNFSTHVSIVNYKDLAHDQEMQLKAGLFRSSIIGDELVPEYEITCYKNNEFSDRRTDEYGDIEKVELTMIEKIEFKSKPNDISGTVIYVEEDDNDASRLLFDNISALQEQLSKELLMEASKKSGWDGDYEPAGEGHIMLPYHPIEPTPPVSVHINMAHHFTRCPGGRTRDGGPSSAEEFAISVVYPLIREKKVKLFLDLDGCAGFAASFLDEVCRYLVAFHTNIQTVSIKSDEQPFLIEDMGSYCEEWHYIWSNNPDDLEKLKQSVESEYLLKNV